MSAPRVIHACRDRVGHTILDCFEVTRARVRIGAREWNVAVGESWALVTRAYDPRQRPMRRCKLRDQLIAATRAHDAAGAPRWQGEVA